MQHDRLLTISAAGSRKSAVWAAQSLYWSEFIQKLSTPARGEQTLIEYLNLPKYQQDNLKDVGGFVGGKLKNNRRKAGNVESRDLITLDLDDIFAGQTPIILQRIEAMGCAYAVYSTRKHEPIKPRLRLILPLDIQCTAEEYQPIARFVANNLGIELCDPSTFEASRLMYWPSCCKGAEYVFAVGDKPFLSGKSVLACYANWRDSTTWAQSPKAAVGVARELKKQGDPTEKQGVVGAFCRVFDIHSAIAMHLGDCYKLEENGRYTLTSGSTVGGGVVYDDGKFFYSHHGTDPASGRLCNAFDLVRLHKFADFDDDAKPETPPNKLPSYVFMRQFALKCKEVSQLLGTERYNAAVSDFSSVEGTDVEGENKDWLAKLQRSKDTGAVAKTTDNIIKILENDPQLKGKVAFDEFANRGLALGGLPWQKEDKRRDWTDLDDAGLRHYIEHVYGVSAATKIADGTALVAHKNRFNDVVSYLSKLTWDGTCRLEELFCDYLGAENTQYTRAVAKKSLTAAVARAMKPGCKYDTMVVLVGQQGLGKSTLLMKLAGDWFSDSLTTFEGKEACELIQGVWINEIGELNGYSRSEKNAVKLFLSRTDDIFREPYGRRTQRYPRRCVFFGTTNDHEFLRDSTGERRFWPVDVGKVPPTKNIFTQLDGEVDQIWAEACVYFKQGEPLYLPAEIEAQAKLVQEDHKESNVKEGLIRDFIAKEVPMDWDKRDLRARQLYWALARDSDQIETIQRTKVCALEIWCEALGGDIRGIKRTDVLEINSILLNINGWEKADKTIRCGLYGIQRGYTRA